MKLISVILLFVSKVVFAAEPNMTCKFSVRGNDVYKVYETGKLILNATESTTLSLAEERFSCEIYASPNGQQFSMYIKDKTLDGEFLAASSGPSQFYTPTFFGSKDLSVRTDGNFTAECQCEKIEWEQ